MKIVSFQKACKLLNNISLPTLHRYAKEGKIAKGYYTPRNVGIIYETIVEFQNNAIEKSIKEKNQKAWEHLLSTDPREK